MTENEKKKKPEKKKLVTVIQWSAPVPKPARCPGQNGAIDLFNNGSARTTVDDDHSLTVEGVIATLKHKKSGFSVSAPYLWILTTEEGNNS